MDRQTEITPQSQAELEQQINHGFAAFAELMIMQPKEYQKLLHDINGKFIEYATNARILTNNPREIQSLGGF